MATKRFAVTDDAGRVVNVILMDDEKYPVNWYPGYGRYAIPLEDAKAPSDPLHPSKISFLPLTVSGSAAINDMIDLETGAVTYHTPPVPPPPSKEELRAYAADKRWQIEVAGAAWGKHRVHTDREAQTKLIAEMVAIIANVRASPSVWKMADGVFVNLSNAEMLDVITTARIHISTAFAVEAAVLAQIEAGAVTTFEQIDGANWP